uniref:Uncharacterized protein n=1 Tax=Anguilla anguilla TaxID=7936 RepID=A0A0E9XEN3_ANGAN
MNVHCGLAGRSIISPKSMGIKGASRNSMTLQCDAEPHVAPRLFHKHHDSAG